MIAPVSSLKQVWVSHAGLVSHEPSEAKMGDRASAEATESWRGRAKPNPEGSSSKIEKERCVM